MRSGLLRHYMYLQAPTRTVDAYGEATFSWTNVAGVWGSIENANANERTIARKVRADVTHMIVIRAPATIDATYRIAFNGRYFQIVSATLRDERQIAYDIQAVEVL